MTIFNYTIRRVFKNKIKLIILLIAPLLFIGMFATQTERALTIGIVDNDNSIISRQLISGLSDIHKIELMIIEENTVQDRIASYQLDYALIIEKDFEKDIINGISPQVNEFYLQEKEKIFYARSFAEGFIYDMKILAAGTGFNEERFFEAFKEYKNPRLVLQSSDIDESNLFQTRSAMGFLVQFMLYMSVVTAGIILEDKSSGVFYRTFYGPVTLKRYIIENLIAFITVGVIQVTLIMLLLKAVFKMDFGNGSFSMYLLFVVFTIVCIALGTWIVSIFKKPVGAYATIVLITTPLVMLGGSYWPMDFMPDILQKIALFIPTTWVMRGVEEILYKNANIVEIYLEVLLLLIFAGIFFSAGLFKKVDISK